MLSGIHQLAKDPERFLSDKFNVNKKNSCVALIISSKNISNLCTVAC